MNYTKIKKIIEQRKPSLEIFEEIADIRKRIENICLERGRETARHKGENRNIDEAESLALDELFQCLDRLNEIQTSKVRKKKTDDEGLLYILGDCGDYYLLCNYMDF